MTSFNIVFCISLCLFFSCEENKHKDFSSKTDHLPQLISEKSITASGPFFTKDENENSVLVWTEKIPEGDEMGHVIKYSTIDKNSNLIYEVLPSRGCRAHDESMNKIAFKSDGTVVAVFSKRNPTKENRFAGALYYTQSFDKGKTWTAAQYLHVGDTTAGLSRSFFDIDRLPNGEIGAVWLDSRLTKKRGEGSSLFFSKTEGKSGFVKDNVIAQHTCECCRTDLMVSDKGELHVAFRDILQDSIRDMAHLISTDNGLTFSAPKRISPDDWVINGCPHSGPSLSQKKDNLSCFWLSMGGGQGLYYTSSNDQGQSFAERKLITNRGRHPQLLALQNDKVILAWEELDQKNQIIEHHHASNQKVDKPSSTTEEKITSFIKVQILENGFPISEKWVSLPYEYAEYPVLTELSNNKIAIAWIQELEENKFGVFYKSIEI